LKNTIGAFKPSDYLKPIRQKLSTNEVISRIRKDQGVEAENGFKFDSEAMQSFTLHEILNSAWYMPE